MTLSIASFQIQFQGGFSCKQLDVQSKDILKTLSFYPRDVNDWQTFEFESPIDVSTLRLILLQPTDFFGRIVVYHIKFFESVK